MGFGPSFRHWVKLLYTKSCSRVLVNGFLTDIFLLSRSVRQGCGLSPLLYALCIQPLAANINACLLFKDVPLPSLKPRSNRIRMYADDTTVFAADVQTINLAFYYFQVFCNASGARINYEKCSACIFYGDHQPESWPRHLKIVDTVKICGIYFGKNAQKLNEELLKTKIQKTADNFKNRHLTHKGKAVLINTLLLANLWYIGTIIIPSKNFLVWLRGVIFSIVWKKNEKIARDTLFLNPKEGGIGLINPEIKLKALWLKHIHRIIVNPEKALDLTNFWCALSLRKYNNSLWTNTLLHNFDLKQTPLYYKVILKLVNQYYDTLKSQSLSNFTSVAYNTILDSQKSSPIIALKRSKPLMITIWSSLHSADLSSEVRELWWQVSHQVLNASVRLFKFKLINSDLCEVCQNDSETTIHCFFQCISNSIAFQKLKIFLPSLNTLSFQDILDLRFNPPNVNRQAIVTGEYLYTMWLLLNNHIFHSNKKLPLPTTLVFLHRLRVRIKTDFARLERSAFHSLWVGDSFPTTINASGNLFIGF
jgi:hypothetical protein